MNEHATKVTAIVGAFRKGGIIDQAVDAILDSAKQQGAHVPLPASPAVYFWRFYSPN